ncbi:TetR/AcrR family transcriptional regulator [Leptolyngbya sp. AN02str]
MNPEKTTPNRQRKPQQTRSQKRVNHILDVAEQLFIDQGYDQTTTRAIAAQAQVPIGSLYQFFPDKNAIVRAIAQRYFAQQYQLFVTLHRQLSTAPIAVYVEQVVDAFDQFTTDHPGYQAILEQVIDFMTVADASQLDEFDQQILAELTHFLAQRNATLPNHKCEIIALTILKTVNELLWLSLTRDEEFRQALVDETKRLITSYLQSYCV